MLKAGILSMQRIANYGSSLQAYGLKKMLEELGCEVQFVDYHPGRTLTPPKGRSGIVRKVSKALEALRCRAPIKAKISFIKHKKNYAANYYPSLGITGQMNYSPELDLLVIGSDEVFNCVQDNANVGFSPELFGEGSRAGRIISYAASFGNTTLQKLVQYKIGGTVGSWLGKFGSVSVRDANSGTVVEAISGMTPEYHLDPVLAYDFLGKCKEIPQSVPEDKYIILYGYSGRFSKEECKAVRDYATERDLKVFCIGGLQSCCDKFIDCPPFHVIAYFQHAECVVTDTFHGTIMAVITHRPFVSVIRNSGYGNSEKLADLLCRLGLSNRSVKDISLLAGMLEVPIDYKKTDAIICGAREQSYAYLKRELDASALTPPHLFRDKADCCGCGACLNACPKQAISMQQDEYGFLYPRIRADLCIGCGKCNNACAFQNKMVSNKPLETHAGIAKDTRLTAQSASGGIFAAMAGNAIKSEGIVFGAAFEQDWSVRHISASHEKDICRLQGSKYAQSSIGNSYQKAKEALAAGKNVLFSGTPCQIAGLYGYLGRDYSSLLTVDIICHGVPSSKMLQDYMYQLEQRNNGTVTAFTFRDKSLGWGINGNAEINQKKKIKLWQSASSYLYYFSKGLIYRDSCYQCKYACFHRPADLTIGDYWGIETAHPEYLGKGGWQEENGISVIIANSEKGKKYIKAAGNFLELKQSEFSKAASGNMQLNRPCSPGKRTEILSTYLHGGWPALEKRFRRDVGVRKFSSHLKTLIPHNMKRAIKSRRQAAEGGD